LDVSGLTQERVVEAAEDRLRQLLAPDSTASTMEITVAKGVKGRPAKTSILTMLKEYVLFSDGHTFADLVCSGMA
jgi:hypothetical protein